ncbi:MAG TPA: hypothetical protein VFP49_06005 [Nitrososphaeraceae archaeon]|nr:hypothetical protein [Nitrososphaeraceae archaeon]
MKENRLSQIDYYPLSTVPTNINNLNIPNFTTAQKLLEDKFSIEIFKNKKIELTLGDKVCFVKPPSDLICDTIVRGHLSKRHYVGLESPTVYVLVSDNKLDFYKIVEKAHKRFKMNLDIVLNQTIVKRIFIIHQLARFLIFDLAKDIKRRNTILTC